MSLANITPYNLLHTLLKSLSESTSSSSDDDDDDDPSKPISQFESKFYSQSNSKSFSQNPFKHDHLSPSGRKILLTLHVMYPNHLLPALDLLDRGMVSLLTIIGRRDRAIYLVKSTSSLARSAGSSTITTETATATTTSSSSTTGRFRNVLAAKSYQCHIPSWSCSCPVFAYSAYSTIPTNSIKCDLSESTHMPMCKHLLACVLLEKVISLKCYLEKKQVTKEEFAAWSAGWGA